jgi:ribosome biogenesis GTPase
MAQAVVYRSTGSWYIVKDTAGKLWNARMKGVFKIEGITSTNPIAVGDIVDFETENEAESGATITKIHDRKNYINRQSPRVKYQHHIVAANVDQSIMVATITQPRSS